MRRTWSVCLLFVSISLTAAQLPVAEDAYTSSKFEDRNFNFGKNAPLLVDGTNTTYVKFDLSSLPPGTTATQVLKATLSLWVSKVSAGGSFNVQRVLGSWSEGSITHSTAPALGGTEATVASPLEANFIMVDLTAFARDWVSGAPNNGVALVANAGLQIEIDSKENTATSHEARLDVVLVNQGPKGDKGDTGAQGPQGIQGPQGTQGPQGLKGDKGETGDVGPIGPQGAQGDPGATGPAGPQGPKGDAGAAGAVGPAGPQGPKGDTGATGPQGAAGSQGPAGPMGPSATQAPLLRWYSENLAGYRYGLGPSSSPHAMAFDGDHVWVSTTNGLNKIRRSDAASLLTVNNFGAPGGGIAFDGMFIWVVSYDVDFDGTKLTNKVITKRSAATGGVVTTIRLGFGSEGGLDPRGIAFDGANIWVATSADDKVRKLRASDGTVIGTYAVGPGPIGIAFDGANIWVTNSGGDVVSKLRASDGTLLGNFPVGIQPRGIAYDGDSIWVANAGSDTVSRINSKALPGGSYPSFAVGDFPVALAVDGTHVWVANSQGNSVTKLRASDGSKLGTFTVGTEPKAIIFDGINIWIANAGSNDLSRL